jgi:hypothetical protein
MTPFAALPLIHKTGDGDGHDDDHLRNRIIVREARKRLTRDPLTPSRAFFSAAKPVQEEELSWLCSLGTRLIKNLSIFFEIIVPYS